MKILIISLPRTGSTSYFNLLSQKYNLKSISEPFNDVLGNSEYNEKYDWSTETNICVKTHINQKDLNFYINFVNYFDEIILLSRKDLIACAESFAYAKYYNNFSEKYNWTSTKNFKKNVDLIKQYNNKLIELSKTLNKNIIYYEDIFNIDSTDRLRTNIHKNKKLI
jgi:hypothetical protein